MFRLIGLALTLSVSLGGFKAGRDVLEAIETAVKVVVQGHDLREIQKQILIAYELNGSRLPAHEPGPRGPLYGFIRENISASGRDPGLDLWGQPYWFVTQNWYKRQLDPARGEFAIGCPGPDQRKFSRDDVYLLSFP